MIAPIKITLSCIIACREKITQLAAAAAAAAAGGRSTQRATSGE